MPSRRLRALIGAGEPEHGDGDRQQAQVDFHAEEPDAADQDPAGDQEQCGDDLAGEFLPAPQAETIVQQSQGHDPGASGSCSQEIHPVLVDVHPPRAAAADQPAEHGERRQEDGGPTAQGDREGLQLSLVIGTVHQADAGREPDGQCRQRAALHAHASRKLVIAVVNMVWYFPYWSLWGIYTMATSGGSPASTRAVRVWS